MQDARLQTLTQDLNHRSRGGSAAYRQAVPHLLGRPPV